VIPTKKKSRYRHSGGKRCIEVRVKSAQQLFDARDPAPFRERDLDDDFVEYLYSAIQEFSLSIPIKIVIYVEESESQDLPKDSIRDAISSFLSYKIDLQSGELRTFIRRAQIFLVIGLIVLGSCIGLAQSLTIPNPPGALGVLREGIVIFGWVSIWKPIELVLFDWYPIYEKVRAYRKLRGSEIEISFAPDCLKKNDLLSS
jgi:hypothetical protein